MTQCTKSAQPEAYNLLRTALALFKKVPNELNSAELTQVKAQAANEYKIENQILKTPEAVKVVITDKELQLAFAEIRGRYEDEADFYKELEKNQLTEQSLRAALYRQCKVNTVLEMVGSRSPEVSEVEIGIYYHVHAHQFNRPELREACHIFISINPEYSENTREAAWARMQSISSRLQKKPHKFADMALKHSECPTALQGGVLGLVPRGKLYPEIDAVLFTLKVGEISEIVETEIGFHLVMCKQIQKAETLSLQKAAPKIRQLIKERSRRVCQRAWLAGLPKESEESSHEQ